MYDTARRVALVNQRVRENTRRRQRCGIYGLSAACMLLFAVLMQAAGTAVGPGQTAAWGAFGAMLLREDAGGYVLVAVVSFAAAVVITALCFRLRIMENQKKDGTDKPERGVQAICTIPQDGSHLSSSGCGKTTAGGNGAASMD